MAHGLYIVLHDRHTPSFPLELLESVSTQS